MDKNSSLFERILYLIESKGLKNVAGLADKMGYSSPQKIYRLKQGKNFKPSYDIVKDFSNKFEDLNLRWFLSGEGNPFIIINQKNASKGIAAEPEAMYREITEEVQLLKAKIDELEIEKKALLLALREIGAGRSKENGNKAKSK